jgi:predicted NBD/HSP70 family sugar kinase
VILAADIGATSAHLALFDSSGTRLLRVETYNTGADDGVAALVERFLGSMPAPRIDSACFGVGSGRPVYAHELAEVFEIPMVVVVDGLEARVQRLRDLAAIAADRLALSSPQPKAVSSA